MNETPADDFRDEQWIRDEEETRSELSSGLGVRFANAHSAIAALYERPPTVPGESL